MLLPDFCPRLAVLAFSLGKPQGSLNNAGGQTRLRNMQDKSYTMFLVLELFIYDEIYDGRGTNIKQSHHLVYKKK